MTRHSYRERNYTFGQVMLKLRTSIGLTQAGLAALLGVSRRAIGEWETPSNYPKAEYLQHFLGLCVQQHVFAPRREEEEIRAFWKTAHQRVLLALPHQKSSFLLFKQTISHDCGSTGIVEETKLEYTTTQKGNRTMPKTQRTF